MTAPYQGTPPAWQLPPIGQDPQRVLTAINDEGWRRWHEVRQPWLRQVEQNIRVLSGRPDTEWIPALQAFVDPAIFLGDWADERWRQRPVFHRQKKIFDLALAKLTEAVPALTALPAGSDQVDAKLAELFDSVFRYEWDQMDIPLLAFQMYGWMLVAGRGVLKLRWDPDRGPIEEWRGPADVPLPNGELRQVSDAPWVLGPDGQPMVHTDGVGEDGEPQLGPAYRQRAGDLAADAINPTALLLPYGPEPPHRKRWAIHEYWLPCDEIAARFGVTVEPDEPTPSDDLLSTIDFANPFGMPSSAMASGTLSAQPAKTVLRGMCRVRERWERDCPDYPYGRLTLVTQTQVLYDDINPYVVPGEFERVVLPFYVFDRVGYPFRQEGVTDGEVLNPISAAINRRLGGLMDAVDRMEQPNTVVNGAALSPDEADKLWQTGQILTADTFAAGPPVQVISPPPLPPNSAELLRVLQDQLDYIGNLGAGSAGAAVTETASGELQKEVRYDTDRPWGATLRAHSYVWAIVGEDLMFLLGSCMSDDRLLSLMGEDNAATFVQVQRELFKGRINVRPMPEASVLETRSEKQARLAMMVQQFGLDPSVALKQLNYPDVNRALRPGGDAYSLAVRENVEMAGSGVPSPVWPEQRHEVHIQVHLDDMQGQAFREAPPQVQQAKRIHLQLHKAALAVSTIQQTAQSAGVAGAQAHLVQQAMPTPPPGETQATQDSHQPASQMAG